jgi:mono/diheme cytochrome c family protein
MQTLAHAQLAGGEMRGELLYTTHCNACHTSEIHWREKKLVTDMDSLKFQVRRWQDSIGLGWTEEEIADVVNYLNTVYYAFPVVGEEGLLDEKKVTSEPNRTGGRSAN